jgi:hypothetical protein
MHRGNGMQRGFWLGKLKARDHLEDLDIDGMKILKWIFQKYMIGEVYWLDLAQGWKFAGPCECENGSSVSTKYEEFLEKLKLFKKDFAPYR